MKQVYKWCENIKITKGYLRSCFYDLQRETYEFGPLNVFDILSKIENNEKDKCLSILDDNEKDWFLYFIENEYLLVVPEVLMFSFPKISSEWEIPNVISNAIIHQDNDFNKIISFLDELVCKNIHLIVESELFLDKILNSYFKTTNFHSVDVIINESIIDFNRLMMISESFPMLSNIYIKNEIDFSLKNNDFTKVIKVNNNINNNLPIFIVNIETYLESLEHNLYLNKKIYFDEKGNLKNSSNSSSVFGNLKDIHQAKDLIDIINTNEFQCFWRISKSDCLVCSDCEFRNMCLDNKIPKINNNGKYYYIEECSYNPYIARWKGEEGYRTLAECGVISNEEGFSIDHEKIAEINEELWGEDDVDV